MNSIQSEVYTILLHLNDDRLRNPDLTEKVLIVNSIRETFEVIQK